MRALVPCAALVVACALSGCGGSDPAQPLDAAVAQDATQDSSAPIPRLDAGVDAAGDAGETPDSGALDSGPVLGPCDVPSIPLGVDVTYEGDTRGAPSGLDMSCGVRTEQRPVVVHSIEVPGNGVLTARLNAHLWNGVVAIRTSCEGDELACAREDWPAAEARFSEATTVAVLVGGLDLNIDWGPYTLEITFVPGGVDPPEPPEPVDCGAVATELPLDTIVSGSTEDGADDLSSCSDGLGPDGVPEVVYAITTGRGLLTYQAETEDGFYAAVDLHDDCNDSGSRWCPTFTSQTCVEEGTHYLVVTGNPEDDVTSGAFDVWATFSECLEGEVCGRPRGSYQPLGCGPPADENEDVPWAGLQGTVSCDAAPDFAIGEVAFGAFPYAPSDLYFHTTLPERGELHTWAFGPAGGKAQLAGCDEVGSCTEAGDCIVRLSTLWDPWNYILTSRFHRCLDGAELEAGQCRRAANVEEVEPNDRGVGAQPLVHGDTVAGEIRWGTTDYYTVDLVESQVLWLDVQEGSISVHVYGSPLPDPPPSGTGCIETHDEDILSAPFEIGRGVTPALACTGTLGARNDGPLSFTAPADGTYFLRVIGSSPYELSVDVE